MLLEGSFEELGLANLSPSRYSSQYLGKDGVTGDCELLVIQQGIPHLLSQRPTAMMIRDFSRFLPDLVPLEAKKKTDTDVSRGIFEMWSRSHYHKKVRTKYLDRYNGSDHYRKHVSMLSDPRRVHKVP